MVESTTRWTAGLQPSSKGQVTTVSVLVRNLMGDPRLGFYTHAGEAYKYLATEVKYAAYAHVAALALEASPLGDTSLGTTLLLHTPGNLQELIAKALKLASPLLYPHGAHDAAVASARMVVDDFTLKVRNELGPVKRAA